MSHRRQAGVLATSCHAETRSSSVLVTLSDIISSGKLEMREGRRPGGGRKAASTFAAQQAAF